jgi:hypothetical protein
LLGRDPPPGVDPLSVGGLSSVDVVSSSDAGGVSSFVSRTTTMMMMITTTTRIAIAMPIFAPFLILERIFSARFAHSIATKNIRAFARVHRALQWSNTKRAQRPLRRRTGSSAEALAICGFHIEAQHIAGRVRALPRWEHTEAWSVGKVHVAIAPRSIA